MRLRCIYYPRTPSDSITNGHRTGTSMGTRQLTLDARTARNLPPGQWASRPVSSARGSGILQARGLQGGAVTYYLRVTTNGKRERIPLGVMPYRDAGQRATELSLRYQAGERDLYTTLKAEQAEREHQRAKAQADADSAATRTLGALLEAYADELERQGRKSARTVRGSLRLHVAQAWPKLWATPTDAITTDNMVAVVGRLVAAGKRDMARQLRAYLRAAYTAAIRARQKPDALPALRALRVTANPAADVAPLDTSRARTRELSVSELRAYWKRIEAMPGIDGALLRFHLLTGGQRIKQLARATLDDYDSDMQALRLLDGKGKRTEPRVHLVPLLPEALDAMHTMQGNPHVFTVTAGQSGATYHVLNKRLQAVVQAMQDAGELERGPFTPGDLRRTVETRLAAAGVSLNTRAHLQSHGISGVQAKHYDRYSYLQEKRAALETLHRIATGTSADVVPMQRKA